MSTVAFIAWCGDLGLQFAADMFYQSCCNVNLFVCNANVHVLLALVCIWWHMSSFFKRLTTKYHIVSIWKHSTFAQMYILHSMCGQGRLDWLKNNNSSPCSVWRLYSNSAQRNTQRCKCLIQDRYTLEYPSLHNVVYYFNFCCVIRTCWATCTVINQSVVW